MAILYAGSYLFLRGGGDITHIENRGFRSGHEVRAHAVPLDRVASQMLIHTPGKAPDPKTLTYRAAGHWIRFRAGFYNVVFFPLRKGEELWWNLTDGV